MKDYNFTEVLEKCSHNRWFLSISSFLSFYPDDQLIHIKWITCIKNPAFKRREVLIIKGWSLVAPPLLDSLEGRDTPCLGSHWGSFSAGGDITTRGLLISMVLFLRATVPCVCVSLIHTHTHTQTHRCKELLTNTYKLYIANFPFFCSVLWFISLLKANTAISWVWLNVKYSIHHKMFDSRCLHAHYTIKVISHQGSGGGDLQRRGWGGQNFIFYPDEIKWYLNPSCLATIMRLEYIPQEMIYLVNVHLVNNPQFISQSKEGPGKDSAEREKKSLQRVSFDLCKEWKRRMRIQFHLVSPWGSSYCSYSKEDRRKRGKGRKGKTWRGWGLESGGLHEGNRARGCDKIQTKMERNQQRYTTIGNNQIQDAHEEVGK